MAETINGLHKAEVTHHRDPWRSIEAIGFGTLEWAEGDWINTQRLLEPIGNIPPKSAISKT